MSGSSVTATSQVPRGSVSLAAMGVTRAPQQIVFGRGLVVAAGALARQCGSRAMICTDPYIRQTDGYARLRASLDEHELEAEVFSSVEPEVPLRSIDAALREARRVEPDVIIAIGGGSAIDSAKLVSLLLAHGGPLERFYGEGKVPGPIVPVLAIPTTAGTGSEVTPVAVLTDPGHAMKVGVSSLSLIPRFALCDPELTDSCPPNVTAHAGVDALAHAIESYTAASRIADEALPTSRVFVGKNRLSDVFALAAIREIQPSLERAVADGTDAEARDRMAFGSLLAGLALGSGGTAAAHALQYPIGASTSTPHGLGIGVLLEHTMKFNWPATSDTLVDVGLALGYEGELDRDTAAGWAIDEVARLCRAIGIPRSLRDLGVSERDLPALAQQAATISRLIDNNPMKLDVAGLMSILRAAWEGSSAGFQSPHERAGA